MTFGLKVWLAVWSFIAAFIMFRSLNSGPYIIDQTLSNIFIFAPTCCVLFGSIFFQVLQHIFNQILLPACVAIIAYYVVLIVLLPYSLSACLLVGIIAMPAAFLHYLFSVKFFGSIDS